MKTKLIFTVVLTLSFSSNVISQLTSDYPFKTFLDSANRLHVTGFAINPATNKNNIFIQKFNSNLFGPIIKFYDNQFGNDRGMDIVVDYQGYSYVSGYIFNQQTLSNDIIVLKLDPQLNIVWNKIYLNPGDDKAYGIDILKSDIGIINEIFVTGYSSNGNGQKQIFASKLDQIGGLSWQTDTSFSGKWDIATDIFADYNNVYVCGYSFQGHQNGDDAIYVTLDKANGSIGAGDVIIHNIPGSNDRPTALTVVNRSQSPLSKSRSVVTSISDNIGSWNNTPNVFRTTFYNLDSNNKVRIKWSKEFRNKGVGGTNIATSIAKDDFENIFVTGYSTSSISENELDFVTIKYKFEDGSYGWPGRRAEFYNFRNDSIPSSSYNDRASTIKVSGDTIVYVAGMSDASPSGFSIIQYKNDNSGNPPTKRWTKVYNPIFETPYTTAESPAQRWATIEVDSEGQPILIAMEWNGDHADWKAIKYDVDGNVIATTGEEDNSDQASGNNSGSILNRSNSDNDISKTQLLQNKPNPFNPSTEIFYSVSQNGFVNIKVYNLLGQEVAALVNEMKQPGNYQIRFDGSGLSSGMYFYKMFVNENLIDGKRMLLLK